MQSEAAEMVIRQLCDLLNQNLVKLKNWEIIQSGDQRMLTKLINDHLLIQRLIVLMLRVYTGDEPELYEAMDEQFFEMELSNLLEQNEIIMTN